MKELVRKIDDALLIFFPNGKLKLNEQKYNVFVAQGDNMSKAISIHKNDRVQINVLKWFSNFWAYLEIKFYENEEYPKVFITVSIFQGEHSDDCKTQLFRAEWDNFDKNNKHPQPHWHIYPFKYDYKTTTEIEDFLDSTKEGGLDTFETVSNQIIDISRIHFAMNGQLHPTRGMNYIHEIKDNATIINWIKGIFNHIMIQLEYVT